VALYQDPPTPSDNCSGRANWKKSSPGHWEQCYTTPQGFSVWLVAQLRRARETMKKISALFARHTGALLLRKHRQQDADSLFFKQPGLGGDGRLPTSLLSLCPLSRG